MGTKLQLLVKGSLVARSVAVTMGYGVVGAAGLTVFAGIAYGLKWVASRVPELFWLVGGALVALWVIGCIVRFIKNDIDFHSSSDRRIDD